MPPQGGGPNAHNAGPHDHPTKWTVSGGSKTRFIESVRASANRVVEVVKRPDFAKVFVLLPKRWRVEQSIVALTGSRHLRLDYESPTHVSASAMLFAYITQLLAPINMP